MRQCFLHYCFLYEWPSKRKKRKVVGMTMTKHCRSTSATITGFSGPQAITFNYVFASFESLQSRSVPVMPKTRTTSKHAIYCCGTQSDAADKCVLETRILPCSDLLIKIGIFIHIISRTRLGQVLLKPVIDFCDHWWACISYQSFVFSVLVDIGSPLILPSNITLKCRLQKKWDSLTLHMF